MSLTINTNLSSLIVQKSLLSSTLGLNQAIERMTTGFKINHAKDNAAGYSISTNMGVKLSSYNVAMDNAAMGLDLITTASDSLDLLTSHMQRIRDLAEQAANGTYGEDSLKAIQSEVDSRIAEINRIAANTEYNGINLFGKSSVAIDESKRVVNQTTFQAGETYYLTSSEDLVKLQDLVNSGVDTTNVTFELMNDIDMSGVDFAGIGDHLNYSFKGVFNGNNHIISNLTSIDTGASNLSLFKNINGGTVDSLGVVNCNFSADNGSGGLAGSVTNGTISNCYVTGNISVGGVGGGLIGQLYSGTIENCYSTANVNGIVDVGGLIGIQNGGTIINCYTNGNVTANSTAGGFVGRKISGSIANSYFDTEKTGQNVGDGNGSSSGLTGITTAELEALIANGTLPQYNYGNALAGGQEFTIQVGIDSSENSKISFNTAFSLGGLNIDVSTSDIARNAIEKLDEYLAQIGEKQTELGSAYNRLDSAIESIGISIENLTSSQSTIRDADIAEESSEYIRNQILQQAAATLLATANQSPSIALQLI